MCATCGCMGKGKAKTKKKAAAKGLSSKQKALAGAANPKDKITGDDFKALKAKKKK